MSCIICIENFNFSNRKKITCSKCECNICTLCTKKYLLDSNSDPDCMNCHAPFSGDFISKNMSKKFYNKELRNSMTKIFLDKEKSKLPETLQKIEASKQKAEKLNQINREIEELIRQRNILRYSTTFEKKEFIRACPVENCRGFLSTKWKYGLCDKVTCSKCNLIKEEGHECKQEDIDTAELIKKDTKPCPKCGFGIFKIDGCSQMWCTQCHTAFDWKTGRIATGTIHNPHFFEYHRKISNGIIPRQPGDTPHECMNATSIKQLGLPTEHYKIFTEYIRFNAHVRNVELEYYRDRNSEAELESMRVEYLMNSITEKKWHCKLKALRKKKEKNNELYQILDMYCQMNSNIINNLTKENYNLIFTELEKLHTYTNEALQQISKRFENKVPQIKWYSRHGYKDNIKFYCNCKSFTCRCYNYLLLISDRFT